ncbi:hypothetical protein T4C_8014 [Trichinella pseudospiralis]|uniref:Uncharacterized protein n=1 Tax=Trichinella pseudospiralis TaxID=6337 RepID=A0A0V1GLR8_TRIPS|nr:hypothetical protein T4C_8014 [Trichinella pseudospiralis]
MGWGPYYHLYFSLTFSYQRLDVLACGHSSSLMQGN